MNQLSTASIYEHYQQLAKRAVESVPPVSESLSGRGIVTCAGGAKYFPCVWVTLHELRRLSCDLPVEVWHLGRHEMTEEMERLLAPLGVRCVDASEVRSQHPARILKGWELKPYSIIHSAFEEVLFLDADNVPVRNPAYLFETPEYQTTGAIFWPDYGHLAPDRSIWQICDVTYRDEPEFESGQIVVDKRRCWKELHLTMHLNEHSDFYYRHIHGDKETFHMAWRMLDTPYAMQPYPIHKLDGVMCQHDFAGERVFQHRNLCKFQLYGLNANIRGFWNEQSCLEHLTVLTSVWNGIAKSLHPSTSLDKSVHGAICAQRDFWYERVGFDSRQLRFECSGRITTGSERMERHWDVRERRGQCILRIYGVDDVTCELEANADGIWQGHWLRYERMPVRLTPV